MVIENGSKRKKNEETNKKLDHLYQLKTGDIFCEMDEQSPNALKLGEALAELKACFS